MSNNRQIDFVFDIMTNGFNRATDAFSRITKRHVKLANTQVVIITKATGHSFLSDKKGELNLVLTKIIGDITGKSSIEFWTKLKKSTVKWNQEAGVNWMS